MKHLSFMLSLILAAFFLSSSAAFSGGPADLIDQATLSKMTAIQLQTEFDATIQMARQAQEKFHNSRGRRLATSFIPFVGAVSVGETAARAQNLMAYKAKLLQLKRELQGRFPKEWDETKKKWNIGDHYIE